MITEFLNRRADIERELGKLQCNYAALLLEWKDARKTENIQWQNDVNAELHKTNNKMTELWNEYG